MDQSVPSQMLAGEDQHDLATSNSHTFNIHYIHDIRSGSHGRTESPLEGSGQSTRYLV